MKNNSLNLDIYQRPTLSAPNNVKVILLHSCCAPCAGEIILSIKSSKIEPIVFFYNPNIHPTEEYEIRKQENKRFCDKYNLQFIDADYDTDNWFKRAKGLEDEPERGKRCSSCFNMRFERTALYAHEHGIKVISSTLGISRWKDMNQINACGIKAASLYPEISYWTHNWRKKGGSARMIELAKKEKFYQQEYCGCVYSLRDTNKHRMANGKQRIRRLIKFYKD